MRHAAWVLAYHGCDRKIGERILAGKEDVRSSANLYDWLGHGAYFWENSHARAVQWARHVKDHPGVSKTRINRPFAVGAIIDPGHCLDLTTHEAIEPMRSAYNALRENMETLGLPLPQNEPGHSADADLVRRKLDCAVINLLHSIRQSRDELPFDTVRYPFSEGNPLFPGSKILENTHIQWCVRDPAKSLLGYFRPRDLKLE